jgi:hypothetical protein
MSTLLTIAFLLCLYVLWVMHTMGPWTPAELLKECIRRVIILPCLLGLASGEITAEAGTLKCRFLLWLYGDDPEIVTYVEEDK